MAHEHFSVPRNSERDSRLNALEVFLKNGIAHGSAAKVAEEIESITPFAIPSYLKTLLHVPS